jgi:hypothetical protein
MDDGVARGHDKALNCEPAIKPHTLAEARPANVRRFSLVFMV